MQINTLRHADARRAQGCLALPTLVTQGRLPSLAIRLGPFRLVDRTGSPNQPQSAVRQRVRRDGRFEAVPCIANVHKAWVGQAGRYPNRVRRRRYVVSQ
jgi:hypothetical protein